jgi:two-component sensor histidine kinase
MNKKLLFCFLTSFFIIKHVKSAQKEIDSITFYHSLFTTTNSPIIKIKASYKLYFFLSPKNITKAKHYLLRGYNLSIKHHYKHGIANFYKQQAYEYLVSSNYKIGIEYSKKAANIFWKINDTIKFLESSYQVSYGLLLQTNYSESKSIIISALKKISDKNFDKQRGLLYTILSQNEKELNIVNALTYILKGIKAFKMANDNYGLFSSYNELSAFYENLKDYDQMLTYSLKAYEIVKQKKDSEPFNYSVVCSNVATSYLYLKYKDSARHFQSKYLPIAKKFGFENLIENAIFLDIDLLIDKKDFELAKVNCKYLAKSRNQYTVFRAIFLLAKISFLEKQYQQSKYYLNNINNRLNSSFDMQLKDKLDFYKLYAAVLFQSADYKTAYKMQEKFSLYEQNLLENKSKSKLLLLQLKTYQIEKEFAEKKYLLMKQRANYLIEKQHSERLLYIISILFFLVIIFVIIRAIKLFRKRNIQLQEFNKLLEDLIEEKDILLREIHHRVKNNFQIINSILSIQSRQKNGSIKSFLTQFSSRIHSMAFVHEKLYGNKVVGQLNVVTFLRELLEHSCATFPDQTLKIDLVVDGKAIYLPIEQLMPIGLIVNELTVNSLKYAFPMQENGMIAIAIDQNDQQVLLSFQDNGIGKIDPTMKNTGLIVVDAFVMKLRGTVIVNHEKGLHYQFVFPKKVAQK